MWRRTLYFKCLLLWHLVFLRLETYGLNILPKVTPCILVVRWQSFGGKICLQVQSTLTLWKQAMLKKGWTAGNIKLRLILLVATARFRDPSVSNETSLFIVHKVTEQKVGTGTLEVHSATCDVYVTWRCVTLAVALNYNRWCRLNYKDVSVLLQWSHRDGRRSWTAVCQRKSILGPRDLQHIFKPLKKKPASLILG